MQSFNSVQKICNGMNYNTAVSIRMSGSNSSESNIIMSAPKGKVNDESERRTLTQEEVDEQIRSYIAPWLNSSETRLRWFRECPLLVSRTHAQGQVPALVLAQPVTCLTGMSQVFMLKVMEIETVGFCKRKVFKKHVCRICEHFLFNHFSFWTFW